jgi:hypothetical protein
VTTLNVHLHPMQMHRDPLTLSPFGYLLSSLGGLAAGIGATFLIWHVI